MIKATNFNFTPLVEYLKSVPYELVHTKLYTTAELYEGYRPELPESEQDYYDLRVYKHFMATGKLPKSIDEATARMLHDQGIKHALRDFVKARNYLQIVGVMGGHALSRTDGMYRQIVVLSKRLTELGFLMLSGGGPGAMEAANLGAWLAGRGDDEMEKALRILTSAPAFSDKGWLSTAFEVIRRYPQTKYESLGIPTWTYGHEQPTPFATHIAKFFDNSIREDGILILSFAGITYRRYSRMPCRTIISRLASPMIFLGTQFWTDEIPVYPLLQGLMAVGKYKNLSLTLTDDSEVIVQKLLDFQDKVKANPEAFNPTLPLPLSSSCFHRRFG